MKKNTEQIVLVRPVDTYLARRTKDAPVEIVLLRKGNFSMKKLEVVGDKRLFATFLSDRAELEIGKECEAVHYTNPNWKLLSALEKQKRFVSIAELEEMNKKLIASQTAKPQKKVSTEKTL